MDALAPCLSNAHLAFMKTRAALSDKLNETGSTAERGHEAWKRTKVERGLTQAQDRGSLIPMEKILRDFGLER